MRCALCEAENRAARRFCANCGAPLARACPECGFANEADERFCGGCGQALNADARSAVDPAAGLATRTGAAPSDANLRPSPDPERRQLTVLFCDLVGSTELAARLDPEDMGEIIRTYQNACAEVARRWEGHIAKYLGDGVLVYFGWPQAHEDDAERAVRAGLELTERISRLRAGGGEPLAARVGIATGLVVVGELIGEGAAREQTVVGETPNLAARLQALARPSDVVIAQATRQLVAGSFELEDLGPHRLKGFAAPVRVWRVIGAGTTEGRFEARQLGRLPPLVGREKELALLLERWQRATEGTGQVVLLSGEPGIGKSRLVQALHERASGAPHARLRCQCSPYFMNSALYPVIEQMERAAGFERDDTDDMKLDKLEALVAGRGDTTGAVPLLAALLALPTAGRYPPLHLGPRELKARTLAALLSQLESLAARQPVLLVLEDAHWLDPTSQEWLELLIGRVPHLPVLAVITFRPEFTPPWLDHAHVVLLTLGRLGREQVSALVGRIADGKPVPAEVAEQIVARTDGVPLFVEELTRTVLDSGLLADAGDHLEQRATLAPLAIPATLQDSLMARLDRLAPVKEVAQIAAVIGRDFSYELLAQIVPLDGARLRDALRQLTKAELIFRRGVPPQASYSFKHALIRDTAYASLLRRKRRRVHAQIAQALEEQFPSAAESRPEVLAHHLTEAGLTPRAVTAWYRAGQRAGAQFAHKEAIAHFRHGLELLRSLPETPERDREEIRLQTALGTWLMAASGPVPELGRAYARARELCERSSDAGQLYTALWGLWYFHAGRMELSPARDLSYQLLGLAERERDRGLLLQGHHAAWTVLQFRGELHRCWEHHEQGLALYDPEQHGSHAHVYGGHDPGVCCRSRGALTLWMLGYPDRAEAMARDAAGLAGELAQPFSLVIALGQATYLHQLRGDVPQVAEQAEATIGLAVEHGVPIYQATGTLLKGWAAAAQGQTDDGLTAIRDGLTRLHDIGSRAFLSYYLALLAEVCARAGRLEDGLGALARAFAFVEDKGERWWEAELHRLEGELLLAGSGERAAAEARFFRALEIARRQGAKALELRAATSLARLWCDQGRRAQAQDVLAPIYGWFTEGFDTADLVDARSLLAEVG